MSIKETATNQKWGISLNFEPVPAVIMEYAGGVIRSNAGFKTVMTLIRFLVNGKKAVAKVGQDKLAKRLNVSVAAVKRNLAALKREGLINYHQPHSPKDGEFLCNEYDLEPILELCRKAAAEDSPEIHDISTDESPEIHDISTVPGIHGIATKQTYSFSFNRIKKDDDDYAAHIPIQSLSPEEIENKSWKRKTDAIISTYRKFNGTHEFNNTDIMATIWARIERMGLSADTIEKLDLYLENSFRKEIIRLRTQQANQQGQNRPSAGRISYIGGGNQGSTKKPGSGNSAKRDEFLKKATQLDYGYNEDLTGLSL